MGTVSQLRDRNRPPAMRIGKEEDAVAVARALAARLQPKASLRDIERQHALEELEALCSSGLLGISAPAEVDGIDISNGILAEIVAMLAESDPSVADLYCSHLRVLEILRWEGSDEQQKAYFERALQGELFSACAQSQEETVALTQNGSIFRVEGRQTAHAGVLFADWIAVAARDAGGRDEIVLIPRQADGLTVIDDWDSFGQRTAGGGTVVLQNLVLGNDALIGARKRQRATSITAFSDLMHAAVDVGIARAAFSDAARPAPGGQETAAMIRRGRLAVRLEVASALLERAARKLDMAQVNADEDSIRAAVLSAMATRLEAASTAAMLADAVFDLAGDAATRIAANLDRHWRNARAHARTETDSLLQQLGGLYPVKQPGDQA